MRNHIRALRLRAGLSQERLGEIAGTTGQQISRLEKSTRKLTQDWAERLAAPLGVRPSQLLDGTGLIEPQRAGEFVHELDELELLDLWRKMSFEMRAALLLLAASNAETIKSGTLPSDRQPDDVRQTPPPLLITRS